MIKKRLILFFVFYFLILLQTSFLVYFRIDGQVPNLVLVFLFLIIFFTASTRDEAKQPFLENFWALVFAGFFIDLYSDYPIGVSITFLFLAALLTEKILMNLKEPNIFVFLILCLIFQCFYYFCFCVLDYFLRESAFFLFDRFFLVQIIYNLFFSLFGFYLFRIFKKRKSFI